MKQVDPRGAVVSIDAIGSQKGSPWPHRSSRPRHDYVLTLKDNHSTLHEAVALWLDEQDCQGALLCQRRLKTDPPWPSFAEVIMTHLDHSGLRFWRITPALRLSLSR